MNAQSTLRPSASSPNSVDGPSAMMSPSPTASPTFTSGRWLRQVDWLERSNLRKLYMSTPEPPPLSAARTTIRVASTWSTVPAASGRDRSAAVARHGRLHAGAHQRSLGLHQRYRLALHVGAHQSAVGVVVLQEGNQRRRDRHQLFRRNVHEVDLVGRPRSAKSLPRLTVTRSSVKRPSSSSGELACAMV